MTVKKAVFSGVALVIVIFAGWNLVIRVLGAEQSGSSPTSSSDSRIKTAYDWLVAKGANYGATDAADWDSSSTYPWGTYWNRIMESAAWEPDGNATEADVVTGKTFYSGNNNRTQKTGTASSVDLSALYNGTGYGLADCTTTFALNCYTQAKGGVDDYNNNNAIPSDAYKVTRTTCDSGNNYCGTGRVVAEKQDPNTGLVWSPQISASSTWFTANNCQYPNGLTGDDGVCNINGEVACYCVKKTSSKTGCEGYDDGNWRLPYQKELMQSYIDGSYANLTDPTNNYWSSTTMSGTTQNAWYMNQNTGFTYSNSKTETYYVRCVRWTLKKMRDH